jgi:hypothetical protein
VIQPLEIPENPLSHDSVLQSKINHACKVIEEGLAHYEKPAILCSFGKDSIVMLWMIREWFRKDLPIVFLRHPWFPRKYAWADNLIAEWELNVYSQIPPIGVSVCAKKGKSELVQHFAMGQRALLMPLGKQNIEGRGEWLCGREDILAGPFGAFQWPWDFAFCGHKSSDSDPLQGGVPLSVDIHQIPNSCHLGFPLRHFTDEDIWKCYRAWDLPFNRLRYGSLEDPKDDYENTFNSDYFPYCSKCLDPNEGAFVRCPKTDLEVTNISSQLPQTDPKLQYAGGAA